jgi:GAF domain-containing protein
VTDHADAENDGFRALCSFFIDEGTLGDTLLKVANLACEVGPADLAGITMLVEGELKTGVFTNPEAPEIDRSQYDSGQGPCIDAFGEGKAFYIHSMERETRWPDFTKSALAHGVLSTLSLPISARGEPVAALNLYSHQEHAFNDTDAERLQTFALQAGIVLTNVQVYWDARQLSQNLKQAMESRTVIDFAIGILMAPGGLQPDDAFTVLVKASQRENRKVRDIAQEIVDRTIGREALA